MSEHVREFSVDLLRGDCERLVGIIKGKGYPSVQIHYRIGFGDIHGRSTWLMIEGDGFPYRFFYGARMFNEALAWAADLELHPSLAAAPCFDTKQMGEAPS